MTEAQAYQNFCAGRWPNGTPVCPDCGTIGGYEIRARRQFQCASCCRQYSAKAGTPFAYFKQPYLNIVTAQKALADGQSALSLSKALGCQYRTAHRLIAKAMETGTAKTEGLGAKHDSAVAKPFAQGES